MSKSDRFWEIIFKKFGTFNYSIFKRIYIYDSLENYQNRVDPPIKRKILYYGCYLLLFFNLVKYVILTLFDDDSLKIATGDVIHIYTTFYRKFYIFLIIYMVVILLFRIVLFYYEKKIIIYKKDIIIANNGDNIFKYKNNEHSLIIIANITYWSNNLFKWRFI